MALIPSERFVFPDLTVLDNLLLGGANDPDASRRAKRLELVYELFPILRERSRQPAGTMSGGQQRMVSLGIALMSGPKLLMLDEPSLGLAPSVVQQIFDTVRQLADTEGLSVLLLEQNVGQALRIVDRVYVMRSGRVLLEETVEQMRARDSYWDCSDLDAGLRSLDNGASISRDVLRRRSTRWPRQRSWAPHSVSLRSGPSAPCRRGCAAAAPRATR